MSTTVTDILRPVAAESDAWGGFDVDQVSDDVVEPEVGDANAAVADVTEQVVIMGLPASAGYSNVSNLDVKMLTGAVGDVADMVVRVRVRGEWLGPVVVTLSEMLSWHTASLPLATSRGELNDLAVGLAKSGPGLVLVDALYVVAQGPAEFVQPGDDLALFDGTEAVSLVRSAGDESLVAHALRRATATDEAASSAGTYRRNDVVWHLPVNETNGSPRLGDELVDDAGDCWTILAVEQQTLGTRYRCLTRRLTISDELTHRVDVERAIWTKDAHGAQVAQWLAWRPGIRARVQPISASSVERRDLQTTEATHQVYFALPIELDHNTRIVHEAIVYRVVSARQTERTDVLTAAEVVEVN